MKLKAPDSSPIARLYAAAREIVDGTRNACSKAGQDAREVRLPILMRGTDMRVLIEAGPKIASRNVIEHAQMQASGQPVKTNTVDVTRTLKEAQVLLIDYAEKLDPESKDRNRILDVLRGLKDVESLV